MALNSDPDITPILREVVRPMLEELRRDLNSPPFGSYVYERPKGIRRLRRWWTWKTERSRRWLAHRIYAFVEDD